MSHYLTSLLMLVLQAASLRAACSLVGPGIWHCPDTGNPTTNGTHLASFFASKPYACGDKIILYAGVIYRGAETAPAGPFLPLKGQTGCNGKMTEIVSSAISEIPPNQKERLADYRSQMPTIEVGGNSAFQLWSDANGGTNHYALRGIRITPSAWTVANRVRMAVLVFNNEFIWTSANLALYSPHDIEVDRCIMEDYEEAVYGDPNSSNTNGNAFLRSVSLGIDGPFQNLYIHDSYMKFDGYTNSAGSPGTSGWIDFTNVTATNPAVIEGTTLTTSLGIAYNASCTAGCDGFDGGTGNCANSCKRVIIRGGTGNWANLNGPRYVRARADGNLDVINPNPDKGYYSGTTNFNGTGKGAYTASTPQMSAAAILVQYAISAAATASNWRIIDNFIEAWAMPVFLGGADGPPIDPGVIQSGSTATSLVLNHVRELKLGDLITFDVPSGSGPSDYCFSGIGSTGCGAVDTLRVGRVTAIDGTIATIEPWGSDGTDGTTPKTGGRAIWNTWKIQGIQVRGNAISRGHLHHNADAGKGVLEMKKCDGCIIDGNVMGGYLDSSIKMVGNVGGTYFIESVNQGGEDPNHTVFNTRFSNNLGAGQLPSGNASCLWGNAMIGNYVHYHSGKTAERIFYEHNVAVGCEAVAQPQFTHIQMLSALNSHYQHNTFAPNMAQTYDYRFASNSDCIPAGTENFPFFPEIGRSYNAGVRDNIIGYGNGAYLGNPNTATCWPTIANDIQKNIIVDTESVGTSTINMAFPNNFPVANYTSFWAGTCAYDSWQNCKLAAENPNRGAASDGGDPGADIEQVRDRIERWSERAGLLQSNPHTALMELNPSSWQFGSTHVAVRFTLTAPLSACTVELFTTRNRSALHADSNAAERLPCARAGSFVEDNMAVFVFGTFAPLSPSKKYFYRITDGPRVMVGEFSTVGARSGAFLWPLQLPAASTLTYASNADFTGAATLPSSTQHSLPIASGTVVYWRVDASGKKAVSIAP